MLSKSRSITRLVEEDREGVGVYRLQSTPKPKSPLALQYNEPAERRMYNKPSNNHISLHFVLRAIVLAGVLCVWIQSSAIAQAATFSLSGTLYQDTGSTTAAAGNTIKLAISTTTTSVFSTTTASGGTFTFTGLNDSGLSSTTPFTLWLDCASDDATSLVSGYVGSSVTSVPLYYNHVLVYGVSTSSSVAIEGFTYDSTDDTDILYTTNGASSTISSGINFFVKQGTAVAPAELIFSGDYTNNATFDSGSGEVTIETLVLEYLAGRNSDGAATGIPSINMTDVVRSGNYLYVSKSADATACSQTAGSGIGCELQVYDISSSTNPVYVAGRDVSASATGTGNATVSKVTYDSTSNVLYVGTYGSVIACSQTAGSATGCELQVYNVADPENPIYVAGRDTSGNSTGTTAEIITAVSINGDYLYIGKYTDATACSQTAGSAIGCEIMVFDISSSTNPIYVAGRDASGSAAGTESVSVDHVAYDGANNKLYVAKYGNATACSQTAGSAIGCELMVFDTFDPTNPVYFIGRDASGSAAGTGNVITYSIEITGDNVYVVKNAESTDCSQTAGSAVGCELMVYKKYPGDTSINGVLEGDSAFNNLTINGAVVSFTTNAATNNLTIQDGIVTAPNELTISGDFSNSDTFYNNDGSIILAGTTKTIDGTLTGTSALSDVMVTGSYTLLSAASTTNVIVADGGLLTNNGALSVTSGFDNKGTFVGGTVELYVENGGQVPFSYAAGRDASGSETGVANVVTYTSIVSGNYLYVGKDANATACSQVAGSAIGCELMVYDISSSTNPTYVAGRDTSGSAAGTGSLGIRSF